MTDFDADEPVPPPTPKRRFWTADRVIGWSGVGIAMMAAFFPWYVFVNEDKFGLEYIRQMVSGDPAIPARKDALDAASEGIPGRDLKAELPPADKIVTGTVAAPDESQSDGEEPQTQPLPAAPREFRLLKVIKGQAMIEDSTGIFVVRQGDILPDQSKVSDLEEQDGKWVLITDAGKTYVAAEK
jgi:hypothetical protein